MPSNFIKIVEVAPRDGLQNETQTIPTDVKVKFIDALSDAGYKEIEVSSFVSPKWVPQLADSEEVFGRIKRKKGITYSALVPNEKGLERAIACKVKKIAVFTAASEAFNKKNINATIEQSISRFKSVIEGAKSRTILVRAYISTAFWCPYEGKVKPQQVLKVIETLLKFGIDELSIGDTIGKATPKDVRALLGPLFKLLDSKGVALHFHDTYGMAIANALVCAEEFGVRVFDSSAGGLGGCPYAQGATGNVATEDLMYALEASGFKTGLDHGKIRSALKVIQSSLGRPFASRLSAMEITFPTP